MPLRNIVAIILRIVAIQWLLWAAGMFLSTMGDLAGARGGAESHWRYLAPFVLIALSILAWFAAAPLLSRLVVGRLNTQVELAGLSRFDLYCFAFVYLGLSTVLGAIGPSLTGIHQILSEDANIAEVLDPHRQKLFYDVASHAIALIAGCVALGAATRWARKLDKADSKRATI